jgi:transposase
METQGITFEQVVSRGCGLDVHKETVVATIKGEGINEATRTFQTFTSSLTDLHDWLKGAGVTHVAMESTGVYWKPIYSVLEESFEVILVNARHIKNVPGHKTDKKDSAWIAKLLLSGLLKGSFIPPPEIRELRELFRYRKKLRGQHSSEVNRLHKILEEANIKLSCVLTDVLGVSGSKIIDALIGGETDVNVLVQHCHGKVKASRQDIKEALKGKITEHHRFMMQLIRESMASIETFITRVEERIEEKSVFCKGQIEQLMTIPGVSKLTAQGIISEIGVDMSAFPNEHHLASWAGMSPGNNESAGKKKANAPLKGTSN